MTTSPMWDVKDRQPSGADGRTLTSRGMRTRTALLEAAEVVFAQHGYHDASIVKITEAAQVAQGTFYLYFASKQQLFDELVRDLNRRVRHAMSERAAEARTRAGQERLGFRGYFEFVAEHPALYRIIRQAEIVAPDTLREHYERISHGYIEGLRAAMADGEIGESDPEVVSWILMGIGEIVGARWVLWGESDTVPDEVFEQVMGFIERGLDTQGDK
ncbi:MAG: TetR/AcrR family transcriptional regulator [Georgenia sp.]